jgi:hypothetical protein
VASLAAVVLAAPPACGDDTRGRAERPGLIASVGAGPAYAGLGAQLQYHQTLPRAPLGVPLAVYGGVAYGIDHVLDGQAAVDGGDRIFTSFAFMAGASAGRNHRACLGGGFATLTRQNVAIEGLTVGTVAGRGAFVVAGYEFLADNGLFARALPLGFTYLPPKRWQASSDFAYTLSVGVGWKPW